MTPDIPIVLSFAGHDPGGGAGIQADIEAIAANRCHAATVITCVTVQDSRDLMALYPQPLAQIEAQAQAILKDSRVAAIKIGLIGDKAIAELLADICEEYKHLPLVLDPVLAAGGGTAVASDQLIQIIQERLLPFCDLITPNSPEARQLAPAGRTLHECAEMLLSHGTRYILITGTHENDEHVINRLYSPNGVVRCSEWDRLPGSYHGSGCTLSATIAALLAQGFSMHDAVKEAQIYTWETLFHGFRSGRGQRLPDRLYMLERQNHR